MPYINIFNSIYNIVYYTEDICIPFSIFQFVFLYSQVKLKFIFNMQCVDSPNLYVCVQSNKHKMKIEIWYYGQHNIV